MKASGLSVEIAYFGRAHRNEFTWLYAPRRQSSDEAKRRIFPRFVGQLERTPMYPNGRSRVQIKHDLDCLFGIGMLSRHEPARIIGADRKQGEIDSTETYPQIAKNRAGAIARIPCEIDQPTGGTKHEATP